MQYWSRLRNIPDSRMGCMKIEIKISWKCKFSSGFLKRSQKMIMPVKLVVQVSTSSEIVWSLQLLNFMIHNKNKMLWYTYELSFRKGFTPKQKRGANACIFWIARRRSHALFTALNWSCQMKKKPGTFHFELKSKIWFENHWKFDEDNLYQKCKWWVSK